MLNESFLDRWTVNTFIRPDALEFAKNNSENKVLIQYKEIVRLAEIIESLLDIAKIYKERAEEEAKNYKELINALYKKNNKESEN